MYTPEVIVMVMVVIVMVMIVIVMVIIMVIVGRVCIPPICRMVIVVMDGCRGMEPPTVQSQSRRNWSKSRRWFVRVRRYSSSCCGVLWTSAHPIVGHQERTNRVTNPALPVAANFADDGLRPIPVVMTARVKSMPYLHTVPLTS